MTYTTEEIGKKLGVAKPIAYGLVQYLIAAGLAKEVGSRREPGQKGKGQLVYSISPGTGSLVAGKLTEVEDKP